MNFMGMIRARLRRAARGTAGDRLAGFALRGSRGHVLEDLLARKRILETDLAEAELAISRLRLHGREDVVDAVAENLVLMIRQDRQALLDIEDAIARHEMMDRHMQRRSGHAAH